MHKVLLEYGRLPRGELSGRLLHRLQRFDEQHARTTGACVFDWQHLHYVRALSYVGVVQVPGLTVEILPKVDTFDRSDGDSGSPGDETRRLAQQNLLYMLSVTGRVPLHDRDLASLATQRLPLLEALALIFVRRLFAELRRGIDRTYVRREENLAIFKGKLMMSRHLQLNAARQERCYVAYDEFLPDTLLNRILKKACQQLLSMVRSARVQQPLREALVFFGGVRDTVIRDHHFDQVHLNRNTQRFEALLTFARLVILGTSPAPRHGQQNTFSLLFPMEVLFEEFIGRFVQRHAHSLGLERRQVHIQARRRRRWLLQRPNGRGVFRLKPDLVIDGLGDRPRVILDTKWKRLLHETEDPRNGVQQSDLYQLYAYATRYSCRRNVLLFPKIPGIAPRCYTIPGSDTQLRIAFVDVSRDLRRHQSSLKAELAEVLGSCKALASASEGYAAP